MSTTEKDAVGAFPDRSDADPSSGEASDDSVVPPPVRDYFPEVERDPEPDTADAYFPHPSAEAA